MIISLQYAAICGISAVLQEMDLARWWEETGMHSDKRLESTFARRIDQVVRVRLISSIVPVVMLRAASGPLAHLLQGLPEGPEAVLSSLNGNTCQFGRLPKLRGCQATQQGWSGGHLGNPIARSWRGATTSTGMELNDVGAPPARLCPALSNMRSSFPLAARTLDPWSFGIRASIDPSGSTRKVATTFGPSRGSQTDLSCCRGGFPVTPQRSQTATSGGFGRSAARGSTHHRHA